MREKDELNLEVNISKTPSLLEVKSPKIDTITLLWENFRDLVQVSKLFTKYVKKGKIRKGILYTKTQTLLLCLNLDYTLFSYLKE